MPRNVRNFWIDVDIDGRETKLSGGPVAADGGMDVTLSVREGGAVSRALSLRCYEAHGTLTVLVIAPDGGTVAAIETDRHADGMTVVYGDEMTPERIAGVGGSW